MASASSNSTPGWPRMPCACGCGLYIPTRTGPNAKYPSRYYYKCPRNPPCKRWIGWCDEPIDDVADSGDNKSRQLNGPFDDLKVKIHSLTERMLAIENAGRVVIFIGIVICVLQLILVICVIQVLLFVRK